MPEKEKQIPNMTYFNDYSLFTEVKDVHLRDRNRGVVMANIIESFSRQGLISNSGLQEVQMYMEMIPEDERDEAYDHMVIVLKGRGWDVEERDD